MCSPIQKPKLLLSMELILSSIASTCMIPIPVGMGITTELALQVSNYEEGTKLISLMIMIILRLLLCMAAIVVQLKRKEQTRQAALSTLP